ncbi:hypothetical protein BC833DRAFT_593481 [Globomyces pollinis-pini]|nr:hypothetical protein BC833DRAFT_593481 [Globomyces pollinis-pini]
MVVDIHDYRYNYPTFVQLKLNHNDESLRNDLNSFGLDYLGEEWNAQTSLELQSKILPHLYNSLDLDPNPEIHRAKTLQAYNKNKYFLKRKRPSDWADKEKEEIERKESAKLMLLMDKTNNVEFYPRFSQISFVEDWRKNKQEAEKMFLKGKNDKNTIRLNLNPLARKTTQLEYNLNSRILRTIKFESIQERPDPCTKMYTKFNIYEVGDDSFEGVLRWGKAEGTSIGGDTLRYLIGNKEAVDHYVSQFKQFYGLLHKCVYDSMDADS